MWDRERKARNFDGASILGMGRSLLPLPTQVTQQFIQKSTKLKGI